jgi:phenylpyruvate tautomerase PptA (4-oxalocrotonate tautomerase family)
MPTIQVKSAAKISDTAKEAIKSELGGAIALIPGKSEQWLMVLFGHCEDLYFQGVKNEHAALVEVGIKGHATREDFAKLASAITSTLTKHTDLESGSIYISFSEYENYGYAGSLL